MPELPETLATHGGSGYVVAPAGFGKTHLIAAAVGMASDRQLVLTHTYAGVNALRRKMRELRVPDGACRVDTIASWALRLCLSYDGASGWSIERPAGGQWPELYRACAALLDHPFVRRIIRASYTGLYVDEYQDCSAAQHRLVLKLVRDLPCRILGDPLQAIFDFEEESPVDWDTEIPGNFEPLGQLDTPHRWLQAGQAGLGAWLQTIRSALEDGRSIDLTQRADGITFRYAVDDEALLIAQGNVCRYFDCERQHLVIAIHKGHQQYKGRCCAVRKLAISEFPKWRKCLISLSFRDKSSVRPVQVGGFEANIVVHRSTAVRGRGGPPPPWESSCRTRTGPVEADGTVDAQNAPTAPWKTLRVFHELPQGLSHRITHAKPRKAQKWRWETRIDPEN